MVRYDRTSDMRARIDGLLGVPAISTAEIARLNEELERIIRGRHKAEVEGAGLFDSAVAQLASVKKFRPGADELKLVRRLKQDAQQRSRGRPKRPTASTAVEPTITSGSVLSVFGPPYAGSSVTEGTFMTTANASTGFIRAGTVGTHNFGSAAVWSFLTPPRSGVPVRFAPLFNHLEFACDLSTYTFFAWPGSPSRASAHVFIGAIAFALLPGGSVAKLADARDVLIDRRVSIRDTLHVEDSGIRTIHAHFICPPPPVRIAVGAYCAKAISESAPGGWAFAQARVSATVPYKVVELFI